MWWRTRRHPLFLSLLLSYHITYDHTHGNISFPVNVCLLHTWYMTDKKVLPIIFRYHYKWPPTDKDDLLSMGSTHWVTYILHIKGKVCLNVIKRTTSLLTNWIWGAHFTDEISSCLFGIEKRDDYMWISRWGVNECHADIQNKRRETMRKNQYLLCDEKTEIFWIIKPASPPGKISFLTIARLSGEGGGGGRWEEIWLLSWKC